jgi:hypothetical protein
MTMHLMSHAYSTINSRKRKPKMTKANIAKWTEECRQHNKLMKRIDSSRKTLEEYIDYIHGIAPKRNPLKDWKPMEVKTNYFQEQSKKHREMYPSAKINTYSGGCNKREPLYYTGERKLLGIATMHKSNAVPIFADDKQQAIDIARMRRG